jgi:hypothetical protein
MARNRRILESSVVGLSQSRAPRKSKSKDRTRKRLHDLAERIAISINFRIMRGLLIARDVSLQRNVCVSRKRARRPRSLLKMGCRGPGE